MDPNAVGAMAALGSAASWSIGAVLFSRIGESLSSFAMTLAKGGVSVLLLAALTFVVGDYAVLSPQSLLYLTASGLLGIALSDTLFFGALKELGARSIILLATAGQVCTVILAVLLLGERLSLAAWLGIALILTGITAGMCSGTTEPGRSSAKGIILGLISMLAMSVSVILTKKGLGDGSTLFATLIRMLAGTLGMLLAGVVTGQLRKWVVPFQEPSLAARFLIAVCVVTFGGFWLAIVAFKYTSVAVATTLISTEPLFVIPLSVFLLKEKVASGAVAGAVLATIGVIVLCSNSAMAG